MNAEISVLIEDHQSDDQRLVHEHGLSIYIETDEIRILFDTGKSGDFIKNAELLKIDLKRLDYVVLSHGHYDHSGGFKKLVDKVGSSYKLVISNDFFHTKYKLVARNAYEYIGNSFNEEYIHKNNITIKYIKKDIFYITENIIVLSNFKKYNDFELPNKKFQIEQNKDFMIDNFTDEIVLVLKHEKGLLVILGCSHVGIVNILKTIKERLGMPIYGIIGGTHLIEADERRLNSTIEFLKENSIQILGMSHCTGEKALDTIRTVFGDKFVYNNTGNKIKII